MKDRRPLLISHRNGHYEFEETRNKTVRLSPKEILDIIREGQEEIQFLEANREIPIPLSAEGAFDALLEALQRFLSTVRDTHWDREWRSPDLIVGDSIIDLSGTQKESMIEGKEIPYPRHRLPPSPILEGFGEQMAELTILTRDTYLEGRPYPAWREELAKFVQRLHEFGYLAKQKINPNALVKKARKRHDREAAKRRLKTKISQGNTKNLRTQPDLRSGKSHPR